MSRDPAVILRERARVLAQPLNDGTSRADAREVMQWTCGGQAFALALTDVLAITATGRLAAVPLAPPQLVGLVTFRGGVLPVYDPRALLGPASGAVADGPWALVVDDVAPFAFLADALPQLQVVATADLQPAGLDLPAEARRCIEGVDRRGWALFAPAALRADPRLTFSAQPEGSERYTP